MTTNYAPLYAHTEEAFTKAVQDTVDEAKANAGRISRTGRFRDSITSLRLPQGKDVLYARVGSPFVSARVKEKGGYMQAKQGDRLYLPAGGGEVRSPTAVRVRATPVITPAGPKFVGFMTRRMAEAAR
jgi:hypothetical protein